MSLVERMSSGLAIPVTDLLRIARSAPYRYKKFEIPKRNGRGTRLVGQPARELKEIQRFLVGFELAELPVHQSATAYVRGGGIKANALPHVKNNFLLKLDFRKFFPSINPSDLKTHIVAFQKVAYSEGEFGLLSRLLFWRPRRHANLELCIGAPSSPFISNTVMFNFDETIFQYCEEHRIAYTRYADDLAFSTDVPNSLGAIVPLVRNTISQTQGPSLELNMQKLVSSSRKWNRMVTGLVLSSTGELSLGRKRKREIRAMLHRFALGRLNDDDSMRLRGLIAFSQDVEPIFVERMATRYGAELITAVKRFSSGRDLEV